MPVRFPLHFLFVLPTSWGRREMVKLFDAAGNQRPGVYGSQASVTREIAPRREGQSRERMPALLQKKSNGRSCPGLPPFLQIAIGITAPRSGRSSQISSNPCESKDGSPEVLCA